MTLNIHPRARYTGGAMTAVLAVILAMTLNAGSASATAITETASVSSNAQTLASAECAASNTSAETGGDDTSAEMTQLDQETAAQLASRVSAMAQEAGIMPHTPAEFVQREGVRAYAIDVEGVKATSVTFPIAGERFVQPSNFTFVLDESGDLAQYSESTVVEREGGILDLNTYREGVLVHSAELDPSADLAGLGLSSAAVAAADPATCLAAVLGVSLVVAGIILVLCGGSCSFPVTPPTAVVCGACIGGFAVVGGASIAAVMGCFTGG